MRRLRTDQLTNTAEYALLNKLDLELYQFEQARAIDPQVVVSV